MLKVAKSHSRAIFIGVLLALGTLTRTPCNAQSQATLSPRPSVAQTMTSDAAAIQAMQTVIAQSGGNSWYGLRSAKESFAILTSGQATPPTVFFLDDWSQDSTRYRRAAQGHTVTPDDHNGDGQFKLKTRASEISVPEFDQSRTLVARFPAAAAEVMLRRQEYVLKVSSSQSCKSDEVCIDIYRRPAISALPEQQWKISLTTGLPETIRYQTTTVGSLHDVIWREVYFLKYANEDGLTVPVSLLTNLMGQRQSWTFVSLQQNPGFDTARFDEETR